MMFVKTCFEFLWKGIAIGALNLISLMIGGAALKSLGLTFPEVKNDPAFILLIMFLSGFMISVIGGIIVKHLKLSKLGTFMALFLMLFLNSLTQMMEALVFAPGIVSWDVVPAIYGQQCIMYLFISAGIAFLFRFDSRIREDFRTYRRSWAGWLWRILAGSGSYVLFYYVFGSINAMLFTGEYYRAQINGLRLPSSFEILTLEPVRGILLVLSVLPVILNLHVSIKKRMIIVGTALFIIGGLLPMIQQINTLPAVLLVASTVEMFFQFFLTGVVATYILLFKQAEKV